MSSPDNSLKPAGAARASLVQNPLVGLILALVAALTVWGVIQKVHPIFRVPKEYDVPSIGMPPERFAAFRRQQDFVDRKHAMVYLGGLGLLLGTLLGIRTGLASGSWLLALCAAPLGALGGAAGGFGGCLVYEYVHAHIGQAQLIHMVLGQLAMATPLGLGLGLGLGLATRTIGGAAKAAFSGVVAGVLAGAIFPVALSILLPAASGDAYLPEESTSRLLWLAILAGTMGLVIPVGGSTKATAPQPSPT